jgi:hypothetical protein
MDRIDARRDGDPRHQRGDDHDEPRWLHELLTDRQDHIDHDQNHHPAQAGGQQRLGDLLQDPLVGHPMLHDRRVGGHEPGPWAAGNANGHRR